MRWAWRGCVCAFVAAATGLFGCEAASRSQACEPISGQGCADDFACTLNEAGDPTCQRSGPAQHFEPCAGSDDCARGFACLEVDGAARCMRMCVLGTAVGLATCAAVAEGAQCLGVVSPQPSVGVCVQTCVNPALPACAPLEDGEPAGCWLPSGLDVPICAGLRGTVGTGALCGVQARCAAATDLCAAASASKAPRCWPAAPLEPGDCIASDGMPGRRVRVAGTARAQVCVPAGE